MKRFLAFLLIGLTVTALMVSVVAGAQAATSMSLSASNQQDMQTAEQLYRNGQYALAAETYQQVADQGFADATLYYNLGLSHLRAGDLGRALWGLRLAQQMEPRDESIQETLVEVRAQIAETASASDDTLGAIMEATGGSVVYQVANLTTNLFTLNELALMALGLWTLFAMLLLVWVLRVQNQFLRRFAKIAAPVVGLALVVAGLTLGSRLYQYHSLTEAVVVADSVQLNSGPGAEYGSRLVLPSGAEVNVLEERGGWVNVMLDGNGPTGWAPVDAVATLRLPG
jgi:hypothetical protein